MGDEGEGTVRLTRSVRQKILEQNDGFEARTYYDAKNFRVSRTYRIEDMGVRVREQGKTSWADSRFDHERVLDPDETHRFLYRNLDRLDTDGLPRSRKRGSRVPEESDAPTDESLVEGSDSVPGYEPAGHLDWDVVTDDEDYDESDTGTVWVWVGGALIALVVARKAAPHVKRWWRESVAPRRMKRVSKRAAEGARADDPRDDPGGVGDPPG